MRRTVVILAVFAVSNIGYTPMVMGAQSVTSIHSVGSIVQPQVTDRTIKGSVQALSVNFRNTSLSDAIRNLSQKSGVAIWYAGKILPNGVNVTYSASNVTLEQALSRVLQGTGIVFRFSSPDKITLAPARLVDDKGRANGVVNGKVTDAKTGKGITGATISLGNGSRGTTSREDGYYQLVGVAAGNHLVTARLVGYAKQVRSVTVGEGATVTIDFKLEPSANVLDQVVVTGTVIATELKAVPNAVTVVTAKQIEERGITHIEQLFRGDVPGLFAPNIGSFNGLDSVSMYSRGATQLTSGVASVPIKTYVDGVELTIPGYLSQIDPRSIERIEILTGPQASTIYGSNALNGVMQIFTKRSTVTRPQMVFDLASGWVENNFSSALTPMHAYSSRISGTEGRWGYNTGVSWDYTGAWTPAKQNQRLGGYAGGRLNIGNSFSLDISARHSRTQNVRRGSSEQGQIIQVATGLLGISSNRSNGVVAPMKSSLTGETFGGTIAAAPFEWWRHELVLGSDLSNTESMSTAPSYVVYSDSLLEVNMSKRTRTSERYTTTARIPFSSLASMTLTIGGDHWRIQGSSVGASTTVLTGNLGTPTITRNEPDKNTGGFMQGQLAFRDALFFTYGLRAEWNPNYGDEAQPNMAPRYGVAYTRDIGMVSTKLRASYGRATRPPLAVQKVAVKGTQTSPIAVYGPYYSQVANDELGPEFQQGGEGGIELYFGRRGSLVVTRYSQTVDDLVAGITGADSIRSLLPSPSFASSTFRDPDGYGYLYQMQYLNVGSIRNQGWELQGTVNVGSWITKGTYSWTKSRVIGITPKYRQFATFSGYQVGRSFDLLPEHTGSVQTTYASGRNTLTLNLSGTGLLYRTTDELTTMTSSLVRLPTDRPRTSLSGYRPMGRGYFIADINGSHQFSRSVDGVLQVQNLTDYYQNDSRSVFASIGRQTKIGLRIRR